MVTGPVDISLLIEDTQHQPADAIKDSSHRTMKTSGDSSTDAAK